MGAEHRQPAGRDRRRQRQRRCRRDRRLGPDKSLGHRRRAECQCQPAISDGIIGKIQRLRGDAQPHRRCVGVDRHHGKALLPKIRQPRPRLQPLQIGRHLGFEPGNQPRNDRVSNRCRADPPTENVEPWRQQPAIGNRHRGIGLPVADDPDAHHGFDLGVGADRCFANEAPQLVGVDDARDRHCDRQRIGVAAGDADRAAADGAGELAADAPGEPGAGARRQLSFADGERRRQPLVEHRFVIGNPRGDRDGDARRLRRDDGRLGDAPRFDIRCSPATRCKQQQA